MKGTKTMAEEKKNVLVIDDGMEEVPITNKFGKKVGVFYFRPTDLGMYERYTELVQNIGDIVKPLENININPDGTSDDMVTLNEVKAKLFEKCDYMFGGNFSEAFFGEMHPFSPVGQKFYCEIALEAVGGYISERVKQQAKESAKRVKKYTQKWDK